MKSVLTLENTTMVIPYIVTVHVETMTGDPVQHTKIVLNDGRTLDFTGDQRLIIVAAIEEFYDRQILRLEDRSRA